MDMIFAAAYHSVRPEDPPPAALGRQPNHPEGKDMRYGGLVGLIVLVADVWAIVNIFQSSASTGDKVLWTVLVIVLPVLGFILWYFLGPRTGRA
jgi:Phospholipase_D-nuclease N-terminal